MPRQTKIFVAPYLIDTGLLTETDPEMDTETDVEIDTDIDRDMDKNSRYCAIWITCDISRRKFQQRYKLVAPLPNENYDMLIC